MVERGHDAVGVVGDGGLGQEGLCEARMDLGSVSALADGRDASAAPSVTCGVVDGESPDVLAEISSPGCAAAIWRREISSQFQAWIDELAPDMLPEARVVLRPQDVESYLSALFDQRGVPGRDGRSRLAQDAAELAVRFAEIMNVQKIRLRLDVIGDNACRKFHLDNVAARLVCTFRGRGTQYGLARKAGDPAVIHELARGAVAVFRGAQWPDLKQSGIVHRSPPISGSGETRLLLVMDPAMEVA